MLIAGASTSDPTALACGPAANAGALSSTAIDPGATTANGVTPSGAASQGTSVAVGHQAKAAGISASALGKNANAAFDGSAALGFGAVTTRANQVVLGGTGSSVTVGDIVASTAAQTGTISFATADGSGTLDAGPTATRGGHDGVKRAHRTG